MNLLNKLTIKNLKLNKKRTVVTVIGILLSVALITAVATMYSSMIKTLINYEVYEKGNFHVAFYDVPVEEVNTIKNTREVDEFYLTQNVGYAKLKESKNENKPYIFVKEFTKSALDNLSVKLVSGRLPENEHEVVIPTHLKTNGRVEMKIGDTINIDVGRRVALDEDYELSQYNPFQKDDKNIVNEDIVDTVPKEYKIVGIIERPASNIETYSAPGYTFITLMDEKNISGTVDVYTRYTRRGSRDYIKVTSSILKVDEKLFEIAYNANIHEIDTAKRNEAFGELEKAAYNYNINNYLITLKNNPLKDSTAGSLGTVVAVVIVIIIVTSVFCIKNSFDISITEKIKQYGMLRSIGATKKQIKRNVFYEATILGLIGIPLGLLSGLLASYILVIISNMLLEGVLTNNIRLVLSYSWVAFAVAIILGLITIYASAYRSARKASKISPIDSIRNSANIKINPKKIKCPKMIKKIFKIGGEISYKNLKRNKKKYRTTIISIVVSVSIFIALSYFINSAFVVVKDELAMTDYNITLHRSGVANKTLEEKASETVNLDNIDDYAIYRRRTVNIKKPKYNEEYIDLGRFDEDYVESDGGIAFQAIGDHQYKKYLKELNLDYDEFKDKGILIDYDTIFYIDEKERERDKTLRKFAYTAGDKIDIFNELSSMTIEVGFTTTTWPFGHEYNNPVLIVSDETFDKMSKDQYYEFNIYYDSSDASKLQDDIDKLLVGENYSINNIEESARMMRNLYTLVAIFLYGFIIVISLIGITNIFNTITTNMNLRKQEFAMLKSIGMTKHEFNNMIRLESIFMGLKALIIGIPVGIGLSFIIYLALAGGEEATFDIPWMAILISIIVVYLLITVLMKYSMNKINRQNTIETIRNENI